MVSADNNDNRSYSAELAHEAGHKLREVIDHASDEAHDITATTIKEVRKKPIQSSLIALAAGFLAGLLLRRR